MTLDFKERANVTSEPIERRLQDILFAVGLDYQRQFPIRQLFHTAGVRFDAAADTLHQIREVMDRSRDLLESSAKPGADAPLVIVWAIRGGLLVNAIEAVLAHALRLRGARVLVVQCDSFLPVCENRGSTGFHRSDQVCSNCMFGSYNVFKAFQLPSVRLGSLVSESEARAIDVDVQKLSIADIFSLQYKGAALGEHIESSVIRHYFSSDVVDAPDSLNVIRLYAAAALRLARASERLLGEMKPAAVLTSHGLYMMFGVMVQLAKQAGIPVSVWNRGYRNRNLRLGNGLHHAEDAFREPNELWEGLVLTEEREHRLDQYLGHRWRDGTERAVIFQGAEERPDQLKKLLGLDPSKPSLALFPNIVWDGQLHYRNVAFPTVAELLLYTVDYFSRRPDRQLVVRAHPMEIELGTRQSVASILGSRFPALPDNVRLIAPSEAINSYALASVVTASAIQASQIGLEMAYRAKPVIVTGGPPYRNKGFTLDVSTPEEYAAMLDRLDQLAPLSPEQQRRAQQYAYHFYFRREIPFPYVVGKNRSALGKLDLNSLADLLPGKDPDLDLITTGILEGKRFIREPLSG